MIYNHMLIFYSHRYTYKFCPLCHKVIFKNQQRSQTSQTWPIGKTNNVFADDNKNKFSEIEQLPIKMTYPKTPLYGFHLYDSSCCVTFENGQNL
jgi:hypothetical protein